jgi:Flp pilus assembly protein CpaB
MKKISRTQGIVVSLVGAVFITYLMVRGVLAIGGSRVPMVMVTGTVKAGLPITESDLRTETMPSKFAVNAVTDENAAIGKLAAIELTPGHPLLKDDISDKPIQNGLYLGEVGVRIPVDLVSCGGAMPGDYVDVLVSAGKQMGGQPSPLSTLLHHKRVVSVYNNGGQKIETTSSANIVGGLSMTPSGVYTPASVEIAVNANTTQERDEVLSAGKVVLSLSPWSEGGTSTGVITQPNLSIPTEQTPPGSILPVPAVTNPIQKAK